MIVGYVCRSKKLTNVDATTIYLETFSITELQIELRAHFPTCYVGIKILLGIAGRHFDSRRCQNLSLKFMFPGKTCGFKEDRRRKETPSRAEIACEKKKSMKSCEARCWGWKSEIWSKLREDESITLGKKASLIIRRIGSSAHLGFEILSRSGCLRKKNIYIYIMNIGTKRGREHKHEEASDVEGNLESLLT